MAYSAAGLSKVAEMGVNGNTLWYYCTLDAAATVDTSAYFTGAAVDMLRSATSSSARRWAAPWRSRPASRPGAGTSS
jgi:hypothetical protein